MRALRNKEPFDKGSRIGQRSSESIDDLLPLSGQAQLPNVLESTPAAAQADSRRESDPYRKTLRPCRNHLGRLKGPCTKNGFSDFLAHDSGSPQPPKGSLVPSISLPGASAAFPEAYQTQHKPKINT